MAVYLFDTDRLTLARDGESLGTDAGWDAVRELARVVTERAANAEWGLLEAVVGEDMADRIREAGNLGETLSLG